jgi:hypothetical protein
MLNHNMEWFNILPEKLIHIITILDRKLKIKETIDINEINLIIENNSVDEDNNRKQ